MIKKAYLIGVRKPILAKFDLEEEQELVNWFQENKSQITEAKDFNPFWNEHLLTVRVGQKINPYTLLRDLEDGGFDKAHKIKKRGQYAHRGNLVDLYPYNYEKPLRIEFVGNKVEAISKFEPDSTEDIPFKTTSNKSEQGLKEGYFVVHVDHGIGKYRGLKEKENQTYLEIEYKKGDRLFVPEKKSDKVTPYVGFSEPKIYRLGGSLWTKTKKKAKEETIEWARKIVREQAERETITRPPFEKDSEMEKSLAGDFDYTLTKDQEQALKEVKEDFYSEKPMDRLVCGDVGFGKTEIALRAAFKVAVHGKQVAFLTPTTILADQHFETFRNRLDKYPINIGILSRVSSNGGEKPVLQKVKEGKVDIVIGTHRLLSDDVEFNDLGLIVIDEEQKFGVKHKQKLREAKEGLDVLSLSATPIPRTLKMALSKLRDISLIKTPPPQKKPIETRVEPLKEDLIKEAILSELKRDGQVFYLHNRVKDIKQTKKKLAEMLPEVDFEILHAQMPDRKVISKMHQFKNKEFDVLITTTIIENGLDLGNVNTLIVENSSKLGLAQAHQLRGRIGRKENKAFAWFFYRPEKLTSKVKKRLNTLKEFSHLGAGFQIALKDLKMRGAGEILGKKQSGTIQKVGLNLYYQLLQQAIKKVRKERKQG